MRKRRYIKNDEQKVPRLGPKPPNSSIILSVSNQKDSNFGVLSLDFNGCTTYTLTLGCVCQYVHVNTCRQLVCAYVTCLHTQFPPRYTNIPIYCRWQHMYNLCVISSVEDLGPHKSIGFPSQYNG